MDAQQECALRIAKEAIKMSVRDIESAFGFSEAADVCLVLATALDKIDKRLSDGMASAYAEAAQRRNSL